MLCKCTVVLLCSLEADQVPTGGRVLPVMTGWMEVLGMVARQAPVYAGYQVLAPLASVMLKKLGEEIDDCEMMFGWFVLMLLDVSWGGQDVWSVYQKVMKWKKCGGRWNRAPSRFHDTYGLHEVRRTTRQVASRGPGRQADPKEFLGTQLWKDIRTEWIKFIARLAEEKQFPLNWVQEEPSEEAHGGGADSTMAEITNAGSQARARVSSLGDPDENRGAALFSVLAQHGVPIESPRRKRQRLQGWSPEDEARNIDKFMFERLEMRRDEVKNVLDWWQDHATRWPWVAHLARLSLAQPATSCASERLFSVAGHVMRQTRSRLTGPNLELLTCLSWNLDRKLF